MRTAGAKGGRRALTAAHGAPPPRACACACPPLGAPPALVRTVTALLVRSLRRRERERASPAAAAAAAAAGGGGGRRGGDTRRTGGRTRSRAPAPARAPPPPARWLSSCRQCTRTPPRSAGTGKFFPAIPAINAEQHYKCSYRRDKSSQRVSQSIRDRRTLLVDSCALKAGRAFFRFGFRTCAWHARAVTARRGCCAGCTDEGGTRLLRLPCASLCPSRRPRSCLL